MSNFPEFQPFPKMARLHREVIITEKLDGTNAQVYIDELGRIFAGSRNRWLTIDNDNYGFARWVCDNHYELLKLGPGRHFGEWWGAGIQRRYGLTEKRFSLFNVGRWVQGFEGVRILPSTDPGVFDTKSKTMGPACCHVVPTIWQGNFDNFDVNACLEMLRIEGSFAAPGFKDPEGIVVYHTAAGIGFKKTLKDDEKPKTLLHSPTPAQLAMGMDAATFAFQQKIGNPPTQEEIDRMEIKGAE